MIDATPRDGQSRIGGPAERRLASQVSLWPRVSAARQSIQAALRCRPLPPFHRLPLSMRALQPTLNTDVSLASGPSRNALVKPSGIVHRIAVGVESASIYGTYGICGEG